MSALHISYLALGLFAGCFSGAMGLGGGIVMIPALIYFYGLTQHQAQGTSLAVMIPPVTLLAALRYYQQGNVKLGMAALIAAGFVLGGIIGANAIQRVPDVILRKCFGAVLLCVSLHMVFSR